MGDWSGGYVADVPYVEQVSREMSLPWLSLMAVLHGSPPIRLADGGVVMELGCGSGLDALVTAATCPHWEVWACDVNPSHIERARGLARLADIHNCTFHEIGFDSLLRRSGRPEAADVVRLPGVFTWVSERNRRALVEVIAETLVPGGLVYVTANVTTGWASTIALRELFVAHAATDPAPSDQAFSGALSTVRQLAADGAASFPLPRSEQRRLDGMVTQRAADNAHEMLAEHGRPVMFDELAAHLARAKCVYLGTAKVGARRLSRSSAQLPGWAADDAVLREMLADLISSSAFRTDLFRRGAAMDPANPPAERDDATVLVRLARRQPDGVQLPKFGREVSTARDVFGPLCADDVGDEFSLGALLTALTPLGLPVDDVLALVAQLTAAGYVAPAMPDWRLSGAAETARRLNDAILAEVARGVRHPGLAAPATGSIVSLDAATMSRLAAGEPSDDPLLARLGVELGP